MAKGEPGIASIIVKENPVVGVANFTDVLKYGTDNAWQENSYGHEIRNLGGYWRAAFTILPSTLGLPYIQEYFENGLGRDVQVFSPDGTKAWEGYISRMIFTLPGVRSTLDITQMGNRVWVRYLTAEGGLIKRTTKQNDTDGQGRFGVKEKVLQGAIINADTNADQAAIAYLNEYSEPRPGDDITISGGGGGAGGEVSLRIFCRGYFDTLNWRTYNQEATTGNQDADAQIQDIVDAVGQFVDSTDLTANTIQVTQEYDNDDLAGDSIFGITRMGDASNNRYIAGMYDDRELIYEPVVDIDSDPALVRYKMRVHDKRRAILEQATGREINPALIQPNNWINVEDLLPLTIGKSALPSRRPGISFIESVTFREPTGFDIKSNRSSQVDVIMAKIGFGGSSQL